MSQSTKQQQHTEQQHLLSAICKRRELLDFTWELAVQAQNQRAALFQAAFTRVPDDPSRLLATADLNLVVDKPNADLRSVIDEKDLLVAEVARRS